MKYLLILTVFFFSHPLFAQQSNPDIRNFFTDCKCKEEEGFWTGTKVNTDIGDNYGSMLYICTSKTYRLISEVLRSSAGGYTMNIGETILEKKEGKKGKYVKQNFSDIFIPDSQEVMLDNINTIITEAISQDEYGKLVKQPAKVYGVQDLLFVPNGESIKIYFALDMDWPNIDYNEHQISEGDANVVRDFELSTARFLEWLR
jgi:hypothetical protein